MKHIGMPLLLAFVATLLLTIIPMPGVFSGIKPLWVLLLLLYVQFYFADYFNLILVFSLGLLLDVLLATIIGEHILALVLVSWIASAKARRFHFFSMGQQMGYLGFFGLLYQLIIVTIDAFLGLHVGLASLFGSAFITALSWPLLSLFIEGKKRWLKPRELPY